MQAALKATLGILANPDDWQDQMEKYVNSPIRTLGHVNANNNLFSHRFTGTSILRALYGWPAENSGMARAVERVREFTEKLTKAAIPGAYLVELIPAMKHLPPWVAGWKREAMDWSQKYTKMLGDFSEGVTAGVVSRRAFYINSSATMFFFSGRWRRSARLLRSAARREQIAKWVYQKRRGVAGSCHFVSQSIPRLSSTAADRSPMISLGGIETVRRRSRTPPEHAISPTICSREPQPWDASSSP